jgi:phosphoserine phosphatase RsbU/P
MTTAARSRVIALAVLFAVATLYQAKFSWDSLDLFLHPAEHVGSPFRVRPASAVINHVSAEARAAGVRVGETVLAINGRAYTGRSVLGRALADAQPGDTMVVEIAEAGPETPGTRRATITLTPRFDVPPTRWGWITLFVLGLATPIFCLLLGFWVAAVRPHDPLAWLLLLLMVSFSQLADFDYLELTGWSAMWRAPAIAYNSLNVRAWPIWMLLFGLAFPAPLAIDRRWPYAKWVLIAPLAIVALARAARDVGQAEHFASVAWIQRALDSVGPAPEIITFVTIGAFFATLGYKFGTTTAPDARRRLRLVYWGSTVSLSLMGVVFFLSLVTGRNPFSDLPRWLVLTALLLLPLFPLTLAYVIVVHRALDVRVVVRQGLQYALARRGILVAQVLVTAGVIVAAASMAGEVSANRPRRIAYIVAGVAVVFLMRRVAERLLGWIDRRFFREAYHAERILTDLSDEVRTMVETAPLIETVARRIVDSLHVERVAALLRTNGSFAPAYTLGFDGPPAVSLVAASPTLERLRRAPQPLRVPIDDPQSWINSEPEMRADLEALRVLGSEVLLPLAARENLLGLLSLGTKKSEEPYSASDLRLLAAVGAQTGLALENSRLTAAVASEVARRERFNREIEIAREVQERLLPQAAPVVPGLDCAGACRPALGVGGDYYDFIDLPEGRLGVAIGDVSGKGIPAALLMAALRASLRGQTIGRPQALAELMANLNRLIYDASPSNRYATFFYAEYEPVTRRLSYVNAGHNAPMVFQPSRDGAPLRLTTGGPVIGLLPDVAFEQGELTLEPGDVIVAFTDGISEAMDGADEEWGEERLATAVRGCARSPASTMIAQLFAAADAFVAGASQHDDMTLVVARVVPNVPGSQGPKS